MAFDIFVLVCILVGVITGIWKGLATQAAGLATIVLGTTGGSAMAAAVLAAKDDLPAVPVFMVCYGLIAAACYGVAALLRKKLEDKKLGKWDKHMGGAVGVLHGLVMATILTFFFLAIVPAQADNLKGRPTAPLISKTFWGIYKVLPGKVQEGIDPILERIRAG
jgi:uncharacterized membrane protein required for colicin V production